MEQDLQNAVDASAPTSWYIWALMVAGIFLIVMVGIKYARSKSANDLPYLVTAQLSFVGLILTTAPMWNKVFIEVSADGFVINLQKQIEQTQQKLAQTEQEVETVKAQAATNQEQLLVAKADFAEKEDALKHELKLARKQTNALQRKLDDEITAYSQLSQRFDVDITRLKATQPTFQAFIKEQMKELENIKKAQQQIQIKQLQIIKNQ
jgi:hypothetical protein